MEKMILMTTNEPSDKELSELMHEVAIDAKRKATIFKKQLSETVAAEINKARLKLHNIKA
jgi:inosine/xanthosine triphosphate pyrophosphatase family protein